MKWFADNSELTGLKKADIPDILLFGGIAVPYKAEVPLRQAIEAKKAVYGHPRAPVKWNMKDLKRLYKYQDQINLYEELLSNSREWRLEVFSELASHDVTVIIACIEAYSKTRKIIKERKQELIGHAFSNGLMRFGLHAKEITPTAAEVVLDWPDGGNSRPFDLEYASAFNKGSTLNRKVTYQCGAIHKLKFTDSVLYVNMHHSTLLQAADLVLGATREVIECCLGKKDEGQGLDCMRLIKDKYRGAPKNVVGRGISVHSGNQSLRSSIKTGLNRLVYEV